MAKTFAEFKKENKKADGTLAALRHSLLLSFAAFIVTVSMFVGTTYAWMTDSVTSGNNKILAGNLDVAMDIYNDVLEEYIPIQDNSLFPTNTLWEPGDVRVAYIQVQNAGKTALDYTLKITKNNEKNGVNAQGQSFLLSDYLVFHLVQIATPNDFFADDSSAIGACNGLPKGFADCAAKNAAPMPSGGNQYFAVIVYMPDDASVDTANYLSEDDKPIIQLNLTLVAEQASFETDAFGSDYDQ